MTLIRTGAQVAFLFLSCGVLSVCKPSKLGSVSSQRKVEKPLSPPETGTEGSRPPADLAPETGSGAWVYPQGTFGTSGSTWSWQRAKALNSMGPIDSGCRQVANNLATGTNALLHVIAFAEGTEHRYDVIYTHARITNGCVGHPRELRSSGGLSSDAAGRYQFLSTTWDGAVAYLSLKDFRSPQQDQAAVYLIEQIRGVTDHTKIQSSFPGFSRWMAKLTYEWASIPGNDYGQGQKGLTIQVLWDAYRSALRHSGKNP